MNEQEVRALVREAIERHLGRPDSATKVAPYRVDGPPVRFEAPPVRVDAPAVRVEAPAVRVESRAADEGPDLRRARLQSSYGHPSHILLRVLPGSEVDDGMCVIEPRVRCNHCGFCQSYGH